MVITLLAVAIVVTGVVFGVWKGFAWQLAGIVSLVMGLVAAIPFSAQAAPFFGATAPQNRFIAMAVIYVVTSLIVYLLALVLRKIIDKLELKHWDRHLGGVLGGIKGWLIVLVLAYFAVTLSSSARKAILPTPVGRACAKSIDLLHGVFPHEAHDLLHPYVHGLDEKEPHQH